MSLLKFTPILKTTLWGGHKIISFKHLDSSQQQVGESWEISGVKDRETLVSEGKYKGNTLRTHAGGVWLNGYSDHLPTVVYLIKEQK